MRREGAHQGNHRISSAKENEFQRGVTHFVIPFDMQPGAGGREGGGGQASAWAFHSRDIKKSRHCGQLGAI